MTVGKPTGKKLKRPPFLSAAKGYMSLQTGGVQHFQQEKCHTATARSERG